MHRVSYGENEWKRGLAVREKIKGERCKERQSEIGLPEGEFLPLPPRVFEEVCVHCCE